jgi:formylglycine-generating enzyme required for sulfatase activity
MNFRTTLFVIAVLGFLIAVSNYFSPAESNAGDLSNSRDPVEMIQIPSGTFLMGSGIDEGRSDERPQKPIYLDSYYIDAFEVTNKRYLGFIQKTGRNEPPNPYSAKKLSEEIDVDSKPVVQVTWYDAVDYCRWAGKRLPTEAEWEKAARGVKGAAFPWGKESPSTHKINFEKNWNGIHTLWPVGSHSKTDSPFGVHDMAGNVREWVRDWYAPDYYQTGPTRNPLGPKQGILKVIKGGSWHSFKGDIRPASRGKGGFALKTDGIGFRCAKSEKEN